MIPTAAPSPFMKNARQAKAILPRLDSGAAIIPSKGIRTRLPYRAVPSFHPSSKELVLHRAPVKGHSTQDFKNLSCAPSSSRGMHAYPHFTQVPVELVLHRAPVKWHFTQDFKNLSSAPLSSSEMNAAKNLCLAASNHPSSI